MVACSVEGCENEATRKGWCGKHYQRWYLYGRLDKIKGIVKGICTVENCNNPIKGHGFCNAHYQLWRKHGKAEKLKKEKRSHPFYSIWFERKQSGILCEEWIDFTEFVKGVSPKPNGNYILIRMRDEPFGPTNFKWQEFLKREENETNKDWWARKRNHRIDANPGLESDRNIKRVFGLTREEYNNKLKAQNFVCAICGEYENSIYNKTGVIKNLAVDHDHKTGKMRDLLCWRCNTTLGKINEDLELVDKIKLYLTKHKETIQNG